MIDYRELEAVGTRARDPSRDRLPLAPVGHAPRPGTAGWRTDPGGGSVATAGRTALPARGSAADRRPDPDRQVARIAAWAAREGPTVGRIETEIGSALKGGGRRFLARLHDPADRGRASRPVRQARGRGGGGRAGGPGEAAGGGPPGES